MNISSPLLEQNAREVETNLKLGCFFGGAIRQIGWILMLIGAIATHLVMTKIDLESLYAFQGTLETARGKVTNVEHTDVSVDDVPIQAYSYYFDLHGQTFERVSYSGLSKGPEVDEEVIIEFMPNSPERSRIQGMRSKLFGLGALFVLIFPGIGLCLLLFSLRSSVRNYRLLRYGSLAKGKLSGKKRTNVTINNRPLIEVMFKFTTKHGETGTVSISTTSPMNYSNDSDVDVLYHPRAVSQAVVLESLSGSPFIDPMGNIASESSSIGLLLIPALAIGVNALIIYNNLTN